MSDSPPKPTEAPSRPLSPAASRLWDLRISKHMDDHVQVVFESPVPLPGLDHNCDLAIIHHPLHDCFEVCIYDPVSHNEADRMYLKADVLLHSMPKDEFEQQFEEKKAFFRKRRRHYDSHVLLRSIHYNFAKKFIQSRLTVVFQPETKIGEAVIESKLIAFLQPQSAQETILIDFLNDDDAMPGQLRNGRRLCHLMYKPDLLIPINTKLGQEEHVFLLFQYFERVRVKQWQVVDAFHDNINARIRRYQATQMELKREMEEKAKIAAIAGEAVEGNPHHPHNNNNNKESPKKPLSPNTPTDVFNNAMGDETATEIGENESELSDESKDVKPKVTYTGVYSKARCRWIYAIHHIIFRNMVRQARERMDIASMSRKSPEKILIMERKRQEEQQMLAALQREAAAQEAAKLPNRRTVVDGIREAANNLSQVINYHSYTNMPASLSRGNSATQMNAENGGGDGAAPPMLGAMGRQMSSPLQSQAPPKLSKQQSWQASSSSNLNASNATGGSAAGGNANVAMSSKAQAAMQETKQKLGQFQLFRNKQNSSSNLNANPTSSSPMTSNSSPVLPILTKQKSASRLASEG